MKVRNKKYYSKSMTCDFLVLIVNSNRDRCEMVTLIDVENLFQLLYSDCRP